MLTERSEKEKIFLKKGIAIIVFLLISLAIYTLTAAVYYTNPKNCAKCHEVQKAITTWNASSHSAIECKSCHYEPGIANYISAKFRELSRVTDRFAGVPMGPKAVRLNESCLRCHALKNRNMTIRKENLIESHSAHINKGYNCADCHIRIVHIEVKPKFPEMKACIECHENTNASTNCKYCHYRV